MSWKLLVVLSKCSGKILDGKQIHSLGSLGGEEDHYFLNSNTVLYIWQSSAHGGSEYDKSNSGGTNPIVILSGINMS